MTPGTESVRGYHQQTKHQLWAYARSLGYMDWGTRPDPFRTYGGAARLPLERPAPTPRPRYEEVFRPGRVAVAPGNLHSISQFFFDSLALSAWKQFQASRWSLRVNPSSGNLHPTEAYLVSGPIPGLTATAGIYHYQPREHVLELRTELRAPEWQLLAGQLPRQSMLIGLTSIHWRESWKYGERAFRYCQHDAGHAIAALAIAAAVLGWQATLLESIDHRDLGTLLGVAGQTGLEAEEPDCLLLLHPQEDGLPLPVEQSRAFSIPKTLTERLHEASFHGTPNRLSTAHHEWPVIDDVAAACRRTGPAPSTLWQPLALENSSLEIGDSLLPARQVIRQRRSAVAMDGRTRISRDAFYKILLKTMPGRQQVPFPTLPWRPRIHLALFVHRVQGLEPGVYFLNRNGRELGDLKQQLHPEYAWTRPSACPETLDLWCLLVGDARPLARTISCHQDIAADGCFAVAMLAEFGEPLREYGPWFYKRLHWEAGLVGQVLYLEAEATGVRGTGIGCFFDDATHEALGIRDDRLQDLYHFTVGGAVEDTRLQTHPAYAHLEVT